ncbi:MAG: penicillin-binding protein activator [Geminicoccaceae bacterium]|nr:penicillin-binding protein activator [Geminicoccaceae bacterium]
MRVKSGVAASGLGLLLLLAACAGDRVPEPAPPVQPPQGELEQPLSPEVRVGLLLPLSGPAAGLARDMQAAAQMALFDVGENDLVLLPRDTAGTPQGARVAAEQVIEEGAAVILGPLFNQAVSAVSPIAAPAGVRVLAFSNVASAATDGTFLLGYRPEEQVTRVVRYALENVGRRPPEPVAGAAAPDPGASAFDPRPIRIAGLAPEDAYGATALAALRRAVLEGGGELGPSLFYPPDEADPSAVIRQIAAYDQRKAALERERARLEQRPEDEQARRELERLATLDTLGPPPFDAIMIADGGDRLRSVASLLTFFDVDPASVRFLGTMRWQDDPRVLAEPALQQGWFAASAPEGLAQFERQFEAAYGRPPQQPALAALAYDATALAAIVASADRRFDELSLTNAQGFAGATGLFRLRPDGLADHGLAVLEVAGGGARLIDPPPASFTDTLAAR